MAARVWSAAADNANWSANASWDGGASVPGAGDTVTFNSTSVHTCNLDSLGAFNGSITIASTYSGTITQSVDVSGVGAYSQAAGTWNCNTHQFSVGANTWALSGGTFSGSSNTITTGAVTFSGGTLTATSGTWNLGGSWTLSNTPTFSANGGTINITASATITDTHSTFNKFTINCSGAVTFAASTTIPLGANPTSSLGAAGNVLTNSGTITYSGTWTHTGGLLIGASSTLTGTSTPTLTLTGDLNANATCTITNAIGTITFNGSGTQTYNEGGSKLSGSTCVVSQSGTAGMILSTGTFRLGATPTTNCGAAGTITNNSTITYSGTWTHTGNLTVSASATVTGSSTPTLTLAQAGSLNISATASGWTSVNVTVNGTGGGATYTDTGAKNSGTWSFTSTGNYTVAASTSMSVGSGATVRIGSGSTFTVNGTLSGSGTLTMIGGAAGGPSNLTVAATGTLSGVSGLALRGNLTVTSGGVVPAALPLTITSANGDSTTINATGITFGTSTLNKTNGSVTITAGTVPLGSNPSSNLGSGTLTVTGTLTYSGTWTHVGSITTSSGSTVAGSSSPALALSGGNLTLNSGGTWTSVNVAASGSTAITYTDTGAKNSGTWTLNTTANFTVAASTTMALGANPTSSVGSHFVSVSGTVTYSGAWSHTGQLSVGSGGTVTGSVSPSLSLTNDLTINSAATWTSVNITAASTGNLTYTDTAAKNTGTWTVSKDTASTVTVAASTSMAIGASPTTTAGSFVVTGTLSGSGAWSHTGSVTLSATGTISGLASLTMTEGSWTHTTGGVFPANLPVTMTQTSSTACTFAGNGQTYGAFVRNGSGTGALTISGSNTFSSFTDTSAAAAHTLTFTAGTTQTAASWALSGAPGARLTINSTAGAATLHSTGVAAIEADYVTISNSTVDASPTWTAGPSATNGGGNTNWIFDQPVSTEGGDNGRLGVHQMAVRSPHYLRKRRRDD